MPSHFTFFVVLRRQKGYFVAYGNSQIVILQPDYAFLSPERLPAGWRSAS